MIAAQGAQRGELPEGKRASKFHRKEEVMGGEEEEENEELKVRDWRASWFHSLCTTMIHHEMNLFHTLLYTDNFKK